MTQQTPDERSALTTDVNDLYVVEFWKERVNLEVLKPSTAAVPHRWRWTDLDPLLQRASEIVSVEEAERRGLLFANPGLFPTPYMTSTLYGAYSLYNPGEPASVHRHTVSASRFSLAGNGGFTMVDGEKCMMLRGDLVITPPGAWHDHGNDGTDQCVWFDMLDLPLVESLNSTMFDFDYKEADPLSNSNEPVARNTQSVRTPPDHSHNLFSTGGVVPMFDLGRDGRGDRPPMLVYRWKEIRATLERLKSYEGDPYDGIILQYVDPSSGQPPMPTLAFTAQLLRPGEHTRAHRHTSSTAYCVVEGEGVTRFEDIEIAWSKNDVLVVPTWLWHEHINASKKRDAVLYGVSDAAALRKLGLYREQGMSGTGDIVPVVM